MKPIAIFRHAPSEGPGHFASFLDRHALAWELVAIDAGAMPTNHPDTYAGLVFMGGPMSVNDPLPWIDPILNLIRQAVMADIPVLGHCLGGQLIAKALGSSVGPNPVKEIGWGATQVVDSPVARDWFGDTQTFQAFHWHGETFGLPPGAVRILQSTHCSNQAYALGKHLGMQCHVEMTPDMIQQWCEIGADEIEAARNSPGVQSPTDILMQTEQFLPPLHLVAETLYSHWLKGIKP